MKYIKSKCLQKAEGKKKGKYLLTLEVSDYDLEMLECFYQSYSPFQIWDDYMHEKISYEDFDNISKYANYNIKYSNWLGNMWHEFWKLWSKHDKGI